MTVEHLPAPRMVMVDDRCVQSCAADASRFTAEQMFAVVLVWESSEAGAWRGWLTTTSHRAMCFSLADLEDTGFRRWLADLPGWTSERMVRALAGLGRSSGLHLVWRRSAS